MSRGKEICKVLKDVRRRIAEENGIALDIPECSFKGECRGTCPRCEAELRYLDAQLRSRHNAGRAVKIAGIAAGALALLSPAELSATEPTDTISNLRIEVTEGEVPRDCIVRKVEEKPKLKVSPVEVRTIQGEVLGKPFSDNSDNDLETIIGAVILNTRTNQKAISDINGNFEIEVQRGDVLRINFIGYATKEVAVNNFEKNQYFLIPSKEVLGQVVTLTDDFLIKKVNVRVLDDGVELQIINKKDEIVSPERYAVSIEMLETDKKGKVITGTDDYVSISPTKDGPETIYFSFRDLFNYWFSQDWKASKEGYPDRIRLRLGDGFFANSKEVIINIPKEAKVRDSSPKESDWDTNIIKLNLK